MEGDALKPTLPHFRDFLLRTTESYELGHRNAHLLVVWGDVLYRG